jgi:hypothetical protein
MAADNSHAGATSTQDYPHRPGGLWIVAGWFLGTVILAVCMAASFENGGASRLYAIVMGAAGATTLVVVLLAFWGAIRRDYWHRTRGYPFAVEDIVIVTRGPLSGWPGRVAAIWQGEQDFKIEFDNADVLSKSCWLRAHELRKEV